MPKSSRRPRSGRAFWERVIHRWYAEGSGSVRAFCRDQGITESSFYVWRRKLADASAGAKGCAAAAGPAFVPVGVVGPSDVPSAATIDVLLPSGVQLRVPPDAAEASLRSILGALGAASNGGREEEAC